MLVLSLFTGAGLLDQAFREQGFCVVSAGDIIYGQDVCDLGENKLIGGGNYSWMVFRKVKCWVFFLIIGVIICLD